MPAGTVSGIEYLRRGVNDLAARPVVFFFNGGPGASSSSLNFGVFGPKRWQQGQSLGGGDDRRLVDNPLSLVDTADLVMIDPPGSGFSRELVPGGNVYFHTAPHDAVAVATFIRRWIEAHGRSRSPIYIVGESYGGYRAALMAPLLDDLPIAGLVLISPALDLSDLPGDDQTPDDHYVFAFPVMALAARFHHRVPDDGLTEDAAFERAASFAQGALATALREGSTLAPAERVGLARRMSAFIGLPADRIAAAGLRIDPQDFLETLVPGRLVGRLDVRVSAPAKTEAAEPGRDKAASDPALGLGRSNVSINPAVGRYLKGLGVTTDAPYVGLNLGMNLALDWTYGGRGLADTLRLNPTPKLARLMARLPESRLLLIGGYYDLTTPVLAQRHAVTHAAIPPDRLRMIALAGPHAVYADDANRAAVIDAVRALLAAR